MFKSRKSEAPLVSRGNKVTNRILTFGLVVFLIYSFYADNGRKKNVTIQGGKGEVNYTQANFGSYLEVKDVRSGRTKYFDLDESNYTKLGLPKAELKNLAKEPDNVPLFEVKYHEKDSCDIIINNDHIVTYQKPR